MKIREVIDYLDQLFHPELQEDYDNSGFLIGSRNDDYHGSLVALDLTREVASEACELGVNLIVTHHPLIFGGVKRLTDDSPFGVLLRSLVRDGINVYAAHTNLDNLPWGVSGVLAKRLGLTDCRVLRPLTADGTPQAGAGMVGELLEPEDAEAFLRRTKALLGIPCIRTTPFAPVTTVKRVALCGGSGAEFIPDAIAARADLYLTADMKYHDFQRSNGHIILADAGHYETEQYAKELIYNAISEKFSTFACRISTRQGSLVHYI